MCLIKNQFKSTSTLTRLVHLCTYEVSPHAPSCTTASKFLMIRSNFNGLWNSSDASCMLNVTAFFLDTGHKHKWMQVGIHITYLSSAKTKSKSLLVWSWGCTQAIPYQSPFQLSLLRTDSWELETFKINYVPIIIWLINHERQDINFIPVVWQTLKYIIIQWPVKWQLHVIHLDKMLRIRSY